MHQSAIVSLSSFALSSFQWFFNFSCKERPIGRQRSFKPGIFHPVSDPLQIGICFFQCPNLTLPWACLTTRLPDIGEQYEVSTFRWGNMCEVRRLLSTGKLLNCVIWTEQPDHSLSLPFWLKCFSYFHLLRMTVFKCRFTSIRHAHYLTLTCLIADRRRSSSRISIPCPKAFRYIVGPAALFRALDSLRSRSGLMIETIPSSDLVSHVLNASLHLQKAQGRGNLRLFLIFVAAYE